VEQVFLRIGFFIYAKAVASLGTTSYAAHMVCMNIMTISFGFGDGLQIANTSLVGQSMGKDRVDMAKIYTGVTKKIGIVIAIVLSVLITLCSDQLAGFFTTDLGVIKECEIPLIILSLTVLFQIPQVIITGALRGAGDVRFVAILMLVSVTLVRPCLTYLLCYPLKLGLTGAWIALFTDQITRNLLSNWRFRQGKWKTIRL
jgi:Na+-driven multidrug efflux pump